MCTIRFVEMYITMVVRGRMGPTQVPSKEKVDLASSLAVDSDVKLA